MTGDHASGYEVELGHPLAGASPDGTFEDPEFELTFVGGIPVTDEPVPYFVARGSDREALDDLLDDHASIERFEPVSDGPEGRLYRCEWATRDGDILSAIRECDGIVRRMVGTRYGWSLSVYFPSNELTTRFHDACLSRDIDIDVRRVEPARLDERHPPDTGLSEKQLTALRLAFERGYFETPKEAGLDDIASRLGITEQALSQRLRRALRNLVGSTIDDLDRGSRSE
ncbi:MULTISPECIES: helix-turn-helix domain-containing protein [unclassified Haloferax]|uniref:helix-turn-helix domain-containing protein n=1 Tax=unclassified Haloferax TaxID=2625095 RepID=UPI000E250092|nr:MULTISPECIES: helix-turn-helix domain-containing protein [unclassified Haloferax]RDZ35507.1 DNA-binding protein [Haloferax sp. Atlit-24N]RLM35919.1 DNA-binding protein [Haloferax sp. Atlit-109R]RLM43769.1 DNA-binding protein [Haloferax sp. Atlit-105R]